MPILDVMFHVAFDHSWLENLSLCVLVSVGSLVS